MTNTSHAEVATTGAEPGEAPASQPLPLATARAAKSTLAIAPHRIGRPPPPVPVDLTHLKEAQEKAARKAAAEQAAAQHQTSKPVEATNASAAAGPLEQSPPAQDHPSGPLGTVAKVEPADVQDSPPSVANAAALPPGISPLTAPSEVAPAVLASPSVQGSGPSAGTTEARTDLTTVGTALETPVEPHFEVPNLSPEERLSAMAAQRDVLIAMLEEEVQLRRISATPNNELARLEQQLRLLYAAAERVDDAVRGIDALPISEREAFKHAMFGVSTWLSEAEPRKSPLRNARALRSFRDATTHLSAVSKLDLKNLALCERVESFGWFTEFPRYEFQPKQQVILYVEVDNFVAIEKSPNSYETELQGHYQIFDARGNIVAERKLPLDRELCRNYRRDYFLAYPIYMPDQIESGKYRLELTIEDLKAEGEYQGRKFGEGMIEFTIRG
jgi:hypothetical protein